MKQTGFDTKKYLEEQTKSILERVGKFEKLYLEFGGKLCYDLHAARVMGANIELWRYKLYNNSTILFEEVLKQTLTGLGNNKSKNKSSIYVEAGKKAAQTRKTGSYSIEEHVKNKPKNMNNLFLEIQEYIMGLDSAIEEVPNELMPTMMERHKEVVMDFPYQVVEVSDKPKKNGKY